MDEELNRAIDAALDELGSVKPSPDFLPRLRAHVEERPRAPIRWWIPVTASLTTLAAGMIVAALMTQRPLREVRSENLEVRSENLEVRSEKSEVRSVKSEITAEPLLATTRLKKRTNGRQRPASEPEVLVPASARAAIVRLVEALNAGDERARGAVLRLGAPAQIPQEILVEPIRIEPVVVPPMKESS